MSTNKSTNTLLIDVERELDNANLMAFIGYKVGRMIGNYAMFNIAKDRQSHVYGLMQAIAPLSSTSDSTRAVFMQVIEEVKKQVSR